MQHANGNGGMQISFSLLSRPAQQPGLDPGIGPDVHVRAWSEGGAVRRYATRSAGSEGVQMARDLSSTWKEGGAVE